MKQSIPLTKLIEWLEGTVTEAEGQALRQQLPEADEATQQTAVWLQKFYHAARMLTLDEPPDFVWQQLGKQFEQYAQTHQPPTLWQRLTAVLTLDTHRQQQFAGIRSATTQGLERQLIYATDMADIVLNIQPNQTQITLMGQIFPKQEENDSHLTIQLLRNSLEIDITYSDELGEFSFTNVETGVFEMVVSGEQFELFIPSIDLHT